MAKVMKQGEDYEEDVTAEDYGEEGDEDTDSKLTSLFGIPIKFLIIGGAALLLLLIAVVIFALRRPKEEDIVQPEISYDYTGNTYDYTDTSTQTDTFIADDSNTGYVWFDSMNNVVGTSYGSSEDTAVENAGEVVGYLSSVSGDPITSDTGKTMFLNTNGNTTVGNAESDNAYTGSNEELVKLGYTGDEIAAAIAAGADLQAMAEGAQALRDQEAKDALIRMSDSASEEFQHIVNQSIFCLPEVEFPETENSFDRTDQTGQYVVNADFWKMDNYGNQLFIKLQIANDTYAFMTMEPMRYDVLPDSGNMVVRIDYHLYGMKNQNVQFYITNITELNVSDITVNPENSATDLYDIVNLDAVMSTMEEDVE